MANDKVEDFKQKVNQFDNNIIYNVFEEKKTTIELASGYMKEGQAISYTIDGQGNINNLIIGEAAKYSIHQVGVRMIGGFGTVATMAGGITWDSKGNIGLYGSIGGGIGFDGSLGIEYINNSSYNSDFNIKSKSLNGASADYNAGAGIPLIGLDFSTGGNANRETLFTQTGNQYKSIALGVSVSPFAIGGSRTFENMGVIKLFNVKR